jgi:hypothetical protein
MRLHSAIRLLDCNFDYESFTKACFAADMNRVRGRSGSMSALLEHDQGTRFTMSRGRACQG